MSSLVIVGLDPGTTTAYAVLDAEGNELSIHSQKEMDLNAAIRNVSAIGRPFIVGTDKKKCPELVEKFAARTGAVASCPTYDLGVAEKITMTRESGLRNDHERDALAAAKTAHKHFAPLLARVRKTVIAEGMDELLDDVMLIVVRDGRSIRKTLDMLLESRREREPVRIIKDVVHHVNPLTVLRRENQWLRKTIAELHHRIAVVRREKTICVTRMVPEEKARELLRHKEQAIQKLGDAVRKKEAEVVNVRREVTRLNHLLAESGTMQLMKKLDSLSHKEIAHKKQMLHIRPGDVLLVRDARIANPAAQTLSETCLIVARTMPEQNVLPVIDAGALQILESKHFGAVDKKELDRARKKTDMLGRIVATYREER
jgi:uncharacterized protein